MRPCLCLLHLLRSRFGSPPPLLLCSLAADATRTSSSLADACQWVVDDFDGTAHRVGEADEKFGKTGYKTIGVAVAEGDGPMKYVGTLPIMDPPRHDTAETIRKIKSADVEVTA